MSLLGEQISIRAPEVKIVTAWAGVGVAHLVDYAQLIASVLAAIYTACLLGEWLWKKFLRGCAERRGWVKRVARRKGDD